MEKILVVIDGAAFSREAVDFACYLARLTHSHLTGIILADEEPVLTGVTVTEEPPGTTGKISCATIADRFRESCIARDVLCHVHRDSGIPLQDVVLESRYADLLVIGHETGLSRNLGGGAGSFFKQVLQEAECPVVVAPERFEQLDEIVFAYDGSATALYAIKQFAHLFPQLRQVPLTVIHVQQHGEWKTDETNKHRLHEWLQVHFEQPDFEVLSGKPGNALFDYLLNKKNILLVMGAYGRNMISQLFKRSNAAPLLDTLFHPVFIAHP